MFSEDLLSTFCPSYKFAQFSGCAFVYSSNSHNL
nr:MAG TPA: hypothetical protein [Caudoviricetes sp.]